MADAPMKNVTMYSYVEDREKTCDLVIRLSDIKGRAKAGLLRDHIEHFLLERFSTTGVLKSVVTMSNERVKQIIHPQLEELKREVFKEPK